MDESTLRRCNNCGIEKPLSDYGACKAGRDGLKAQCRDCLRATGRQRVRKPRLGRKEPYDYQRHRAKHRAARVARDAQLRARTLEQRLADRDERHPDGTKRCPACRETLSVSSFYSVALTPDGLSLRCCQCQRSPLAKIAMRHWQAAGIDPNFCTYCGQQVSVKGSAPDCPPLHIDHVVPVSRGGPSEGWNLVPSCAPCNTSKGNKDVTVWMDSRCATRSLL